MLDDIESPQIICKKEYSKDDIEKMTSAIRDEYNVQWLVDDLPASVVFSSDSEFWYEDTHPLGFIDADSKAAVIYNHIAFTILYHKNKDNSYRIVGVHAAPSSIDYVEHDGKLLSRGVDALMMLKTPCTVTFTYTVQFEASEIDYGSRWDIYLKNARGKGAHWFSLMNSFCMALFLTVRSTGSLHPQTIAGIIILRTLSRDILMYNSITEDERIETVEEGGWKLIHGDVFRPPEGSDVFASLVGVGVVLFTMLMVIVLAAAGVLSPKYRGSIMTAAVILFVFMGFVAGYSSSRLNLYFGGKKRRSVIIFVGVLLPATIAGVTLVMNIMWFFVGSPQFIHLTSILKLILLWFCVSLPLVYLGSLLGYRLSKYHMPVRTNHIERQIPTQPWYLRPWLTCFVGGCIPFGAIFLEVYFLMSSVMSHQMYVVFGFLLAIFVLMLITTAEIAIVLCYFQLASEDYRWWWRSFVNTGCTALFVFAFSLFYMLSHGITKIVSVILYLCLMMMACIALFLACGTIGFYACFWFTMKIYGSLKVDCHFCFTHVVLLPDFAGVASYSQGYSNFTITAKTFLDIEIDGMPVGRIVIGLYGEVAPLATENFRGLCTGEYYASPKKKIPMTYKGSRFQRIIPGFIVQGGHVGVGIYGKMFDNDPFVVSQNRPGIVAMANLGKNRNAAEFYITLANVAYLDKKLVAFGTVLEGMDVVYMMEQCGSKKGMTKW
ncbi:uncharacterized protein [Blastocystis hominis]|uniref:Transmembrane 9 superfamily member n=1 Tax=Blastocystis hominis TaxID=12968 RepID=D8MBC8_BLAHO|nr:uncharacterized protein [Blastocystis hominis]CBK25367.2 unnamed protein product [Blastocystis hominis]|eukprot:XP_012899415.1 uncharacterized protein [Blastocystis hominis]